MADTLTPGTLNVKKGRLIVSEGDKGHEMFIIEDGRVDILKRHAGEDRLLRVLEAGDFFGEMAILDDQPRGASARAQTDVSLLVIDATTFNQMLREYPEIAVRMLRNLCQRLRDASADPEGGTPVVLKGPRGAAEAAPAVSVAGSATGAGTVKTNVAPPVVAPAPAVAAVPKSGSPGKLVVDGTGLVYALPDRDDIKVGRHDSVTGITPEVDLTDADTSRTTSRRHAKIVREDGKLFVCEEIGTSNGTFVNGERITTGVKVEIHDGDEVWFGRVKTVYHAG